MIWRSRSWVACLVMLLSETGSLRSISVMIPPRGVVRHQLRDQRLFAADEDIAANEVFELADVARPVIVLHQADGTLREQLRGVLEGLGVVVDEVVNQNRQIGDSLAQGRKIDRHGVDAEEEVQAEGAVLDLVAKIAVRGRDEAGGNGAGFVTTHADEGAVLQDLKELGLNREIETANLIQEESADDGPARPGQAWWSWRP